MSSEFGRSIRFSVFGESHGGGIGLVIDGLPPGEAIDLDEVRAEMRRRAPGRSPLTSPRREDDVPTFLSGLWNGRTCGTPLCAVIPNTDADSRCYQDFRTIPRPGHADHAAALRYGGFQDWRGGGHFSGRLTAPLCLGGAVCRQILRRRGVEIGAHLEQVGPVRDRRFDASGESPETLRRLAGSDFPVLEEERGGAMRREIEAARRDGDSVGGSIECLAAGFPAGVGSPMFDGVENRLAQAIFGIPGVKGLEFGSGFAAAGLRGSVHNDPFCLRDGRVLTETNHHGGILGGISSGMPIVFRVALKPTPSIGRGQRSLDLETGRQETLRIGGRHDPCIVLRAVPVVEGVAAMALLDLLTGDSGHEDA